MFSVISVLKQSNQQAYLLIDEYDNFANDLIGANEDTLYYEILSKTGFVRTFYEAIKSGAQEGAISRIFLTGVSPIMLDDLTSGFNIASNITLDKEFNDSLGFTCPHFKFYRIQPLCNSSHPFFFILQFSFFNCKFFKG